MFRGGGRGRGSGRGTVPTMKNEDRDLLGFANKRVANEGPPAIRTFAASAGPAGRGRGRGRGGLASASVGFGVTRGRGTGRGPAQEEGRGRNEESTAGARGSGGGPSRYTAPAVPSGSRENHRYDRSEGQYRQADRSENGARNRGWAGRGGDSWVAGDSGSDIERGYSPRRGRGSTAYRDGGRERYRRRSMSRTSSYSPPLRSVQDGDGLRSPPRTTSRNGPSKSVEHDREHRPDPTSSRTAVRSPGPTSHQPTTQYRVDLAPDRERASAPAPSRQPPDQNPSMPLPPSQTPYGPSLTPASSRFPLTATSSYRPVPGPSSLQQPAAAVQSAVEVKKMTFKPKNPNKPATAPVAAKDRPDKSASTSTAPTTGHNPVMPLCSPASATVKSPGTASVPTTAQLTASEPPNVPAKSKAKELIQSTLRVKMEPETSTAARATRVLTKLGSSHVTPPETSTEKGKNKGKAKPKEAAPLIKQELGVSRDSTHAPAAVEVDIKPIIFESPVSSVHVLEQDHSPRRAGTLAIKKLDAPVECWSGNRTIKSEARLALKQEQARKLKKEGKKLVHSYWMDDGAAFDWELRDTSVPSKSKKKERKARAEPVEIIELDELDSDAKSDRTADLIVVDPDEPSTVIANPISHSNPTQSGRESYTVKLPPHLATAELRADNWKAYKEYKHSLVKEESNFVDGKPTRRVWANWPSTEDEDSVRLTIAAVDPCDPSTWPTEYWDYRDVYNLDALGEKMDPDQAARREENIRVIASDPDDRGRPTRFVSSQRTPLNQVRILTVLKTEAQIENYFGEKLTPDPECLRLWPLLLTAKSKKLLPKAPPLQHVKVGPAYYMATSTPGPNSAAPAPKEVARLVPSHTVAAESSTQVVSTPEAKKKKQPKKRDREPAEQEPPPGGVATPGNSDKPSKKARKAKAGVGQQATPSGTNDKAPGTPSTLHRQLPVAAAVASNIGLSEFPKHPRSTPPAPSPFDTTFAVNLDHMSTPMAEPSVSADLKVETPEVRTSPHLEHLNKDLRRKVAEIEKWTKLLREFPDLADALSGQISRTQAEIFGLHDEISKERYRLSG
ncbi:hypothetical protein IAU60_002968 [Kwoniella sp. DSM 27419]